MDKALLAYVPTRVLKLAGALMQPMLEKAPPLNETDYEEKFQQLADGFREKVQGYGARVASGDMSAAQFRAAMTGTIRTNYTEAYRLGMGAQDASSRPILADADRDTVRSYFTDELNYVDNFAADIKERAQAPDDLGGQYSAAYMDNRTGMYADAIRGLYWAGRTSQVDGATQQVNWIAMDDGGVCDPCQQMADGGPYNPDDLLGQMPGADVCEGLDRCRCHLEYEDIPQDGGDGSDAHAGEEDLTDEGDQADLTMIRKYSPDQARDERGRFGEGGGGFKDGSEFPKLTASSPDKVILHRGVAEITPARPSFGEKLPDHATADAMLAEAGEETEGHYGSWWDEDPKIASFYASGGTVVSAEFNRKDIVADPEDSTGVLLRGGAQGEVRAVHIGGDDQRASEPWKPMPFSDGLKVTV